MNQSVTDFANFIVSKEALCGNKDVLTARCVSKFKLIKDRKVYSCEYFAVRFCYSRTGSFSNTVLSLSALQKYDHIPFLVVLVQRDAGNRVFLANTTFLSKISHSSQALTLENIRGSFNGSDIIKTLHDIPNQYDKIEELYAYHAELGWTENFPRLVEATNNIQGISHPFAPTEKERKVIWESFNRAVEFVQSEDFHVLKADLDARVCRKLEAILIASHIPNVNIRGRLIEYLITSDHIDKIDLAREVKVLEKQLPTFDTKNSLGDYTRTFDGTTAAVDIKTKIIYLNSNPKAYNIDKFLEFMAKENSVFLFYFVGIDETGVAEKILCSVYHQTLAESTRVQPHWSGRNTRGTAQFIGEKINELLVPSFANEFDEPTFRNLMERLGV